MFKIEDIKRFVAFLNEIPNDELILLFNSPRDYNKFIEFKEQLRALGLSEESTKEVGKSFLKYPHHQENLLHLIMGFGIDDLKEIINKIEGV